MQRIHPIFTRVEAKFISFPYSRLSNSFIFCLADLRDILQSSPFANHTWSTAVSQRSLARLMPRARQAATLANFKIWLFISYVSFLFPTAASPRCWLCILHMLVKNQGSKSQQQGGASEVLLSTCTEYACFSLRRWGDTGWEQGWEGKKTLTCVLCACQPPRTLQS